MIIRPRRLRRTPGIRDMIRENSLSAKDFIAPLFIKHGKQKLFLMAIPIELLWFTQSLMTKDDRNELRGN